MEGTQTQPSTCKRLVLPWTLIASRTGAKQCVCTKFVACRVFVRGRQQNIEPSLCSIVVNVALNCSNTVFHVCLNLYISNQKLVCPLKLPKHLNSDLNRALKFQNSLITKHWALILNDYAQLWSVLSTDAISSHSGCRSIICISWVTYSGPTRKVHANVSSICSLIQASNVFVTAILVFCPTTLLTGIYLQWKHCAAVSQVQGPEAWLWPYVSRHWLKHVLVRTKHQ